MVETGKGLGMKLVQQTQDRTKFKRYYSLRTCFLLTLFLTLLLILHRTMYMCLSREHGMNNYAISIVLFPGLSRFYRAREENSSGRIVHHCLMWLAMKLVVAQFCRAKDHEIINEGAECVQSENAMQFFASPQACRHVANCLVGVSLDNM